MASGKDPQQCGMPVGTTTVPQSSLFPLSPHQNQVTQRLKSKASPSGGISLPSCAGLGKGLCLTGAQGIANDIGKPLWVCVWGGV